ncbi:MAG: glycosyltransferase [Candidatus Hydrogenedentes bacterium]|nr:glycosyltransferase [Candidatus Hydrogenedentota bacterium]
MTRPKVCILVKENVSHWAPLYVEAFRELCDVITIGPPLNRPLLESLKLGHTVAFLEPNDIITETDDVLNALAQLPAGWKPDLLVGINSSGPAYRNVHRVACPTAYLSVDTWHEPQEFITARSYEYVFAAQRALVPWFRDAGCRHAAWVPLGCSPRRHFPIPSERLFDIVFVGSTLFVVNEQRVARLARLSQVYNVGTKYGVSHEEMSQVFALGHLAFNSSIAQDLNMRVFEVLAMGLPLLTNRDAAANGLFDLFADEEHLITYSDDDLVQRAGRYLEDVAARERIATAGRAEVLARHTYRHRVETILETVGGTTKPLGLKVGNSAQSLPLRTPGRPSAYLPHGARRVLDIGFGMDHSRVALRHAGVEEFFGVGAPGSEAGARSGSYDQVLHWPIRPEEIEFDMIVWKRPLQYVPRLPEILACAHRLLAPGGTLVLLLEAGEWNNIQAHLGGNAFPEWVEEQRFYSVADEPLEGGGDMMLVLRKFVRPLHEIARQMYREFPGGQLSRSTPGPDGAAPSSPPSADPSP